MSEYCNANEPASRATERPLLVPLLEMIRTDRATYPSAMPMVIRSVEPVMRSFIEHRTALIGFDHAFAEDVLQDALLVVSMRAHQCRATTDRAAMRWMLSVAHSTLSTALRRDGPRRLSLDDERSPIEPAQTFDESIGRRAEASPGLEILLRLVVDASRALSGSDASLLWMRLIAEEEWGAIGATLGISATAARRRFQRAQKTMRRRVKDALVVLPPAARDAARSWLRKCLAEDVDADGSGDDPGD